MRAYAWRGLEAARFELAFVDLDDDSLTARGTQVSPGWRLEYALDTGPGFVTERLTAQVETVRGSRTVDVKRGVKPLDGEALDVDLAFSPLFNSLPILRDRLHERAGSREYVMAFVDVPELSVERSKQEYIPLGAGAVRFRAGSFSADLDLDQDGFVLRYPGLAERVS